MSARTHWNIEQDRGRTWEEAEALLIAEHPDHEENIRNFRRHWHEMVPHAYDDSVAHHGAADRQRPRRDAAHQLGAADTFVEARQRFAFLERPRGITVSGEIRQIKPDRAIYDHHVEAFGLDPAATFSSTTARRMSTARRRPAGRRCCSPTRRRFERISQRYDMSDRRVLRRWHEASTRSTSSDRGFFADDATSLARSAR